MADWFHTFSRDCTRFVLSMRIGDWVAFGIVLLLLAVLLGWLLSRRAGAVRRGLVSLYPPAPAVRWVAETFVVLMALFVAVGWALWVKDPFGLCQVGLLKPVGSFAEVVGWTSLLTGLIMLTRCRLSTLLFLLLSMAWTALWCYLALRRSYLPMMEQLHRDIAVNPIGGAMVPSLLIPGLLTQGLRLSIWVIVSFLGGIYFVRNGFAWWKFVIGSLLGGYLVVPFITPIMMTSNWYPYIQPLVLTVFGAFLLWLPSQRQVFERLLGMPLRRTDVCERTRRPLVVSVLGHACLLALAVCLMALAFVGFFERRQLRFYAGLAAPRYHTLAERNAYPILRQRFLKTSTNWNGLPKAFNDVAFMSNVNEPINMLDVEGWARADLPKIRKALGDIAPYFDDFTSASQCDYYEDPVSNLSFLSTRETARALHTRAMLDIHDGNTSAALDSIAPLIGFYRILKDSPLLVYQMIGVAVAGVAENALYNYYMALRHSPQAMEDLSRFLEERRDRLDIVLNVDVLRSGEFMDVTPNADFGVPSFMRVDMNSRGRALQFQQLRLAAALECYRARHGDYPESLEKLVPEFMPILPLDPFAGKTHKYERRGNDFSLTVDHKPDGFEGPEKFPPMTPEEVVALRKSRAGHAKGHADTTATARITTGTVK